jgi:ABC-type amino acid transport substrate-binding protein
MRLIHKALPVLMGGVWACSHAHAAELPALTIGVAESDGPAIVKLAGSDAQPTVVGGLSREIGDSLAHALGTRPRYQVLSRNRVDSSLEQSRVDVVCNANPAWYRSPDQLGWTNELYPQIERLVSKTSMSNIQRVDQLAGHRVGTILGYSYASVEPLWHSHQASKVSDTRADLQMKSLLVGVTDVAINSELELDASAQSHPKEARQVKMHPMTLTVLPTMCAVAPKSAWSVAQLNQAIAELNRTGEIKTIFRRYQWQGNR